MSWQIFICLFLSVVWRNVLYQIEIKCPFSIFNFLCWLLSYEWNKCLQASLSINMLIHAISVFCICPCSGAFWSWLRLLKLKMLRQRHIYLKLRCAIWFFLPLHTRWTLINMDWFSLTLFSCNIIIWLLSWRLLVKHMKICRHRTKICWTKWLRGMTIILRYILFSSSVNTISLLFSPFFHEQQQCLGYFPGLFYSGWWKIYASTL